MSNHIHDQASRTILVSTQMYRPAELALHNPMQPTTVEQPVATLHRKQWLFIAGIVPFLSIAAYCVGCILVTASADESILVAQRFLAIGQPLDARQELRWLVWFVPDHATANFLIGQSLLEEKKYHSAIPHFELIASDKSEFRASQHNLAGCLLNDNQLDKAELVLRRTLKLFPESLTARRELSALLLGQMRNREAIHVLQEPIAMGTEIPTVDRLTLLRDLLQAQFLAPTAEECLPNLQKAHDQHPGQAAVMAALSECLLNLGRESEARPLINQLNTIPRYAATAKVLMIRLLISEAKHEEARRQSEETFNGKLIQPLKDMPGIHAQFHILRSKLYELAADYEAANNSLEYAASILPLPRASAIRYARLQQKTGKTESASKLFATIHHQAESELALWHLSGKIRDQVPSHDECSRIAQLLDNLDKQIQSAEWRRMTEELSSPEKTSLQFGMRTPQ